MQIRSVLKGESVGYGATRQFEQPGQIATLAIGYGDGLPRACSNKSAMHIHGGEAPIAGVVSMDLTTVDISDFQGPVSVGDVAEFFGSARRIHLAAQQAGTIPYELLTGLGGRVDRRYV